jgi:hypothetical protein
MMILGRFEMECVLFILKFSFELPLMDECINLDCFGQVLHLADPLG